MSNAMVLGKNGLCFAKDYFLLAAALCFAKDWRLQLLAGRCRRPARHGRRTRHAGRPRGRRCCHRPRCPRPLQQRLQRARRRSHRLALAAKHGRDPSDAGRAHRDRRRQRRHSQRDVRHPRRGDLHTQPYAHRGSSHAADGLRAGRVARQLGRWTRRAAARARRGCTLRSGAFSQTPAAGCSTPKSSRPSHLPRHPAMPPRRLLSALPGWLPTLRFWSTISTGWLCTGGPMCT